MKGFRNICCLFLCASRNLRLVHCFTWTSCCVLADHFFLLSSVKFHINLKSNFVSFLHYMTLIFEYFFVLFYFRCNFSFVFHFDWKNNSAFVPRRNIRAMPWSEWVVVGRNGLQRRFSDSYRIPILPPPPLLSTASLKLLVSLSLTLCLSLSFLLLPKLLLLFSFDSVITSLSLFISL